MKNFSVKFTTEDNELAASQEENARLSAQNEYLKNRVVLLRAMVNKLMDIVPDEVVDALAEEAKNDDEADEEETS